MDTRQDRGAHHSNVKGQILIHESGSLLSMHYLCIALDERIYNVLHNVLKKKCLFKHAIVFLMYWGVDIIVG